jgi:hypothetical protein
LRAVIIDPREPGLALAARAADFLTDRDKTGLAHLKLDRSRKE